MNRRGFMGFLGSGAAAGPSALKSAVAKISSGSVVVHSYGIPTESPQNLESGYHAARNIMSLLRPVTSPAKYYGGGGRYADIEGLVSVSPVQKARMSSERERDEVLTRTVGEFIQERKLNLVGLTEESVLALARKVAGE